MRKLSPSLRAAVTAVLAVLLAAAVLWPSASAVRRSQSDSEPVPVSAAFTALAPVRVFDSREVGAQLPAQQPVRVDLAAFVPAGTSAVQVNVTIVDASDAMFASLWPHGSPMPLVSNVNAAGPGVTVANFTTVKVSDDRALSLFVSSPAHVAIDLAGFFTPTVSARAGRLAVVEPVRVLDTRDSAGVVDGGFVDVDLSSFVPADAIAAVVTVTVVGAQRGGFVSLFPADGAVPWVSNVNVAPGVSASNAATVQLSSGRLRLSVQTRAALVVDLVGFFTGPSAELSSAGLFVPVDPRRIADTRVGQGVLTSGARLKRLASSSQVALDLQRSVGLVGVSAVLFNLTMTGNDRAGFVTAFPSGDRPWVSTLFAAHPGSTVAAQGLVATPSPAFSLFSSASADLVVDLAGFFTLAGTPTPTLPPTTLPPAPTTPTSSPPPPSGFAPGVVPYDDPTGAWKFLSFAPPGAPNAGMPVQWDACRPIRIAVNWDGAPPSAATDLAAAVADVAQATGLTFQMVGSTSYWNSSQPQPPPGADVLVAFVDGSQWAPMTGGVVGLASSSWMWGASTPARRISGVVALSKNAAWSPGFSGLGVRTAFAHEFGHLVGLGHASQPAQTMFPILQANAPAAFASGDLVGLSALGSAAGCLSLPAGFSPQAGDVQVVTEVDSLGDPSASHAHDHDDVVVAFNAADAVTTAAVAAAVAATGW